MDHSPSQVSTAVSHKVVLWTSPAYVRVFGTDGVRLGNRTVSRTFVLCCILTFISLRIGGNISKSVHAGALSYVLLKVIISKL